MSVFRVEKNKGYTVMSNHHLRNKDLSLKAKGLLSQMLSLPEDWDYTLKGLALINREKIDAIRQAIRELEQAGYIVRSRERDERGRLRGADYVIYEQPQTPPTLDLPTLENPTLDNPTQEKPTLENPTQLNKDRVTKDQSITDPLSTHSIPSLSPPPAGAAALPPERKRTEAATQSAVEIYRELIKENIEYDHLLHYESKYLDLTSQIEQLQSQQRDLQEAAETESTMKKRIAEFRRTLEQNNVLEEFDRYVFESIVEKVIVGGYDEEGRKDPAKLTFIYKTGFQSHMDGTTFKPPRKNSKAAKQAAGLCSHPTNKAEATCSHHSDDTCGDGCLLR